MLLRIIIVFCAATVISIADHNRLILVVEAFFPASPLIAIFLYRVFFRVVIVSISGGRLDSKEKVFDGMSIPVAERSKPRVCGRSLAGVAGSNPSGSMGVCVVCCTVRTKGEARTRKYG